MKRKLITCVIILMIWQMASCIIGKEVILPFPSDVFLRMASFCTYEEFYLSIFYSLIRIFESFLCAFIIGVGLGVMSGLYVSIRQFLQPVMTVLQTIPQIGYILVLLVWFRSSFALFCIVFFMLMPVFYHNALQGIINIDSDLKDVILLYHHSFFYNLRYAYLPLIKGYILSAINTCLPLSLKVGVMAEIFVSSKQGIGKQLYLARVQIDMVSIFAWIIWLIIIIVFIQWLMKIVISKLNI